jgi:signal transduction histidine kinase
LGALVFAAGGLFWMMVLTFKREIRNVYYTQMQQHAQKTAEAIARATPQAFREGAAHATLRQWAETGLSELVHAQQAVKAVMIVDLRGRVGLLTLAPESGLNGLVPDQDSAQFCLAADLLDTIRKARPNLEVSRFSLLNPQTKAPYAWLDVLYDTTPPQGMVVDAAARAAGQLTLFLVAVGAVAGVIALQQRTTRRLREQRDQAEQLAYVGTLAAGLAHEIRNPLNALAMQLEMLEEDVQKISSPHAADRIQRIRGGMVSVERTVSEFLNYAAPGRQKPAMVDLQTQLDSICSEFAAERPQGQGQVECHVAPGLEAWCDVNALRQIVDNLLANGWNAQTDGQRRLSVEAARQGEWVTVVVEDAGPGVSEGLRQRIFECFFSTRGDGTGLGLPIARRLAEMNGGQLELAEQRAALGGARFVVRLPVRRPRGRG